MCNSLGLWTSVWLLSVYTENVGIGTSSCKAFYKSMGWVSCIHQIHQIHSLYLVHLQRLKHLPYCLVIKAFFSSTAHNLTLVANEAIAANFLSRWISRCSLPLSLQFSSMSSFHFILFYILPLHRFHSMCWIDTGAVWCSVNGIPKWIITEWIRSCRLFCLFRIDGHFSYLNVLRWISHWRSSKCIKIFGKRFNHITLHCTNHGLSWFT